MTKPGLLRLTVLVWMMLFLGGCATAEVQPWERGRLARWDMQWEPDTMKTALREHTHFSKEGSNGRVGSAGGGCGCN